MKKLLALLLLSALLCACGKGSAEPKADYVLPGEIRLQDGVTYRLSYDGDEMRIGSIDGSYRLLHCDGEGRLVKETVHTPNGKERSATTYQYDPNGNLTEKSKRSQSGVYRDVYTYDERGNRLSWRYGYDGAWDGWYEYTYDERGNQTAWASYDADGSCRARGEAVYDERGNQTASVHYDEDGKAVSRNEYIYDEHGRKHTWTCYDSGVFRLRQEYTYDEHDALLQTVSYTQEDGRGDRETYAYDERGNRIEYTVYDSAGAPAVRYTYTYDERGNQTECAVFQPADTLLERYGYTYDENGHPTGQTICYADGSEKTDWQVAETVTASASEAQAAFYWNCILKYAVPSYVH